MVVALHEHIKNMLLLGKRTVDSSPLLANETGMINSKGDKTIGMDTKVESALVDYIKGNNIPADIFSEEVGMIRFHPDPHFLIAFDPLDGSTNYKLGKNIYPYGLLIAAYQGLSPKLGDVVTSGAIEYTHNLAWIYRDKKTYDINGDPVTISKDWKADKSTPIYLDLYFKDGYEGYRPLAQELFIRNMGSTVGNLSYVLSNIAAGLGGICMMPEEIGAVVSLVKGAGGIVVDNKGRTIDEELFSPEKKYQILAGNKHVVEFIVDKLCTNNKMQL